MAKQKPVTKFRISKRPLEELRVSMGLERRSEVLRRAIALLHTAYEGEKRGERLYLVSESGERREIVI